MAGVTATITPDMLTSLGFEMLAPGVSCYRPRTDHDRSDESGGKSTPTLIILCSWAFAQPKHIAKYITPYQSIYPDAAILLIQCMIANTIWKPDSWQMNFFQPAASAIQAHLSSIPTPRVLVHAFSNGGSYSAVQLSQACRETCGGMRLPVDALLLDSCPGQPRFWPTIAALTQGIPSKNYLVKGAATVLSYASVAGTALLDITNISEPAVWKLYRKLNDPSDVFLLKQARGEGELIPRTYLYSKTDEMIMEEDVLGHARVAREKVAATGFDEQVIGDMIRVEEFIGTAHVNHIKHEASRYWAVVTRTWEMAQR